MFSLSLINHKLSVPPCLLNCPLVDAIKSELEHLFLDKVVANLGLCVSVYDVRSVDGGFVNPGDGCPNYLVTCRLLMFRPFVGEVLIGKIKKSDETGLQITLGFFDDIHIPKHLLPQPSRRGADGNWVWVYMSEDNDTEDEFPLEIDEEIRFKVTSVKYPPVPTEQKEDDKPFAPMEITGEIAAEGLGVPSWWQ